MIQNTPCVILSGGKSSRMGRDKSLLPFCNYKTLIEYQYRKLSNIFKDVYISSKTNKFDFDCNIIYDKSDISSPMVALNSIFDHLKSDKVFIIAVDTPFVKEDTINILLNQSKQFNITIAKEKNRTHNLCGVFSNTIKVHIEKLLTKNIHKIDNLIDQIGDVKTICISDNEQFTNINIHDDYINATKISNSYI